MRIGYCAAAWPDFLGGMRLSRELIGHEPLAQREATAPL